jgi:predicted permease
MVFSGMAADVRVAARRLRAAPLFSLFAVASLALGVGVTTVGYAVVADLFFASFNIRHVEDVVGVAAPRAGTLRMASLTRTDFDELQRAQRSFLGLAAWSVENVTLAGRERTVRVPAEAVSGDYFQTLGIAVLFGRAIQPQDEAQRAPVAVLGHAIWRDHFGADRSIVGRAVRIDGRPFEVVGVAPESYTGVVHRPGLRETAVWVPLDTFGAAARGSDSENVPGGAQSLLVLARLRSPASVDAAASELASLAAALDEADPRIVHPGDIPASRGWTARPAADLWESPPIARLGMVFAGLVTLVLIVACTNLANLVLARGTLRQQDVAVRRALGAGQWRLVREQLAESAIIASAGGLAAYGVIRLTAIVAARDLPLFPGLTLSIRPEVDATTLAVATVALFASLVIFGLEPAMRLVRTADVRGPLAITSARMGRVGRYRLLLRWQVAVSTAFFIIAVIAVRYIVADLAHDPGVRLDGLVVAQLEWEPGQDAAAIRQTVERVLDEGRRSSLRSVAISSGLPFGTGSTPIRVSPLDADSSVDRTAVDGLLIASTPDLLAALDVPVVRGRALSAGDDAAAAPAAIVSESAARALFGTIDAVGRSIQIVDRGPNASPAAATIVGVARDTDTTVYMAPARDAVVYVPLAQRPLPVTTVVARSAGDEAEGVATLLTTLRRADADLATAGIGAAWERLAGPFTIVRYLGNASVSLGALTLLLAMVGLYGIQSQGVTLRAREFGVRLSFGATSSQIRRMVLKDGYRPVIEGLVLGLTGGITGRALIRTYLDVPLSVVDPWMLALVPVPLVLAAFCAGYVPAHRAARVDPAVALRDL